ncbi:MAG TPA: ATP-binding cassette domain-containing protein [Devosia sp.]|jgi:ABC-type oligopeptide transport system ATPase subunit|uniref:ATP-binding cassette domain-containing protein n=1 Tax=Devosia sp. TaxID=1871048 RepID=UPI002DDD312A|nr:ATP-binding cassette domain-containing protein [Devosia sp.]HEV2517181.1 ATP-binding cassette domain-containing protein [Devosia sp.]
MLQIDHISKSFSTGRDKRTVVLDDIALEIHAGQSIGLVGESGSGKSTIIRCALGLMKPDTGNVRYGGIDVHRSGRADMLAFRREVQLVFQDPYASLNPRMTVEELVGEGLLVHKLDGSASGRRRRVVEMLEMVGLGEEALGRYPRSFSGGQRQRIAIARALVIRPQLLICDEPVSALDVSVQAQVINLLQDMQRELNLGILFVAHDLAVVRHLCSTIAVLERGKIVERGTRGDIFDNPQHPYTRSLLAAVPIPDPAVGQARRAKRQLAL